MFWVQHRKDRDGALRDGGARRGRAGSLGELSDLRREVTRVGEPQGPNLEPKNGTLIWKSLFYLPIGKGTTVRNREAS